MSGVLLMEARTDRLERAARAIFLVHCDHLAVSLAALEAVGASDHPEYAGYTDQCWEHLRPCDKIAYCDMALAALGGG